MALRAVCLRTCGACLLAASQLSDCGTLDGLLVHATADAVCLTSSSSVSSIGAVGAARAAAAHQQAFTATQHLTYTAGPLSKLGNATYLNRKVTVTSRFSLRLLFCAIPRWVFRSQYPRYLVPSFTLPYHVTHSFSLCLFVRMSECGAVARTMPAYLVIRGCKWIFARSAEFSRL